MGIFHTIAKLTDKSNPLAKYARKKGGFAGTAYNILDPGAAVSHKVATGSPLNAKTLMDPNGWGTPDKPAKDMTAEEQEAARQQRVTANVGAINNAYAGREQQYADYANALRTKYTGDLTRQYATAARQQKFALAGAGQTGGSLAADQGEELGRQMAEGTVAAESKVGQGESGLRAQDENARLQMISLAQAGGDIGDAAMQTGNMLRANLQNANGTVNELGDVFGNVATSYKAMQEARNLRRGLTTSYENIYGGGLGRAQPATR
jgi:hypothetical protein